MGFLAFDLADMEDILIGPNVRLRLVRNCGRACRLLIDAPRDLEIKSVTSEPIHYRPVVTKPYRKGRDGHAQP